MDNHNKQLDVHTLDSCYSRPPAIHNDLLDLAGVQDKVDLRTPLCQVLHLPPVSTQSNAEFAC